MADIGFRVGQASLDLFRGQQGLPNALAELAVRSDIAAPVLHLEQIQMSNVAPELAEKTGNGKYPQVLLYCDKVTNQLREKFRKFSGTARMVAETRVTQSYLDGLEAKSRLLADAVTEVLDSSRGDWGNGMFYAGGYEVSYSPIKPGGKNLIQITKVTFEVNISSD